jgi:SAM-dependent methyltransferase
MRRRRRVFFGSFRRTAPIDPGWGFARGRPIDRYYIGKYLESQRDSITGHVLEISSPGYTKTFGSGVTSIDVLMVSEGNPEATIVADLTDAPQIASDTFDCAVVTQTIQFIPDYHAAFATLHRILKPGGVLLLTAPCITKLSPDEDREWGQWWHFTSRTLRAELGKVFGDDNVEVEAYGNVLSATSFLWGLATSDLKTAELDHRDRAYEVLVAARAEKAQR